MRNSLFYLFPHLFKYACVISVLLFLWLLSFSTFAATYEDDLSFIKQYDTPIILSADQGTKQIIISAKHQARVMTSSANGMSGLSNGWFDYQAIKNNKSSGGEDRFWLAPIGTKHSLYYPQGEHFVGEQWFVPKAFSSQVYPLVSVTPNTALFKTELRVNNMSGTAFYVNLKRKITLFDVSDVVVKLNIPVDVWL